MPHTAAFLSILLHRCNTMLVYTVYTQLETTLLYQTRITEPSLCTATSKPTLTKCETESVAPTKQRPEYTNSC